MLGRNLLSYLLSIRSKISVRFSGAMSFRGSLKQIVKPILGTCQGMREFSQVNRACSLWSSRTTGWITGLRACSFITRYPARGFSKPGKVCSSSKTLKLVVCEAICKVLIFVLESLRVRKLKFNHEMDSLYDLHHSE